MKADADSAHVPVPPPLLLLASILLGVGLQWLHPLHFVSGWGRWLVGGAALGFGIATVLRCAGIFQDANTAIEPWKTTSRIVESGPYRWSRNPIYLSFILIGLGVGILADNLWIVLLEGPLAVVLTNVVIEREERYLEGKFGEPYRAYKNRVRRWL